jgi:hypothetical protein
MVTENDDGLVGVEFLMGAGWNLAHWHENRIREVGGLVLPGFAYIEQ